MSFSSLSTARVMVALNIMVCLSLGTCSSTASRSSSKPISIMRSASSMTTSLTLSRTSIPLSHMSLRRPGVPTMMSAPLRMSSDCLRMSAPPYTGTLQWPERLDSFLISASTCMASSLVGAMMRTDGTFDPGFALVMAIMEYAPVLPVPVCALAMRSRPSNPAGTASICTGVGSVQPMSAAALTISGDTPRSSKEVIFGYLQKASRKEDLIGGVMSSSI